MVLFLKKARDETFMKKICALMITLLLFASRLGATVEQERIYDWKDLVSSTFLLVAGSWVANKQLPRLAGQQIECNAPVFTKALASLFFTIGIMGGILGAYRLARIASSNYKIICEREDNILIYLTVNQNCDRDSEHLIT